MAGRQTRLTPAQRLKLKSLAGKATQAALGERFGLTSRQVRTILDECPDCASCGAPTIGQNLCQRCAEDEVTTAGAFLLPSVYRDALE